MKTIELHLFTNSTIYAPATEIIENTYESFKNVFDPNGEISVYVWCDSRPYIETSRKYILNLMSVFGDNVTRVKSLSDGYIRAIKRSDADILFMLEHDWEFQSQNIDHTLEQIVDEFRHNEDMVHFRFNRRKNEVKGSDHWLEETQGKHMTYCVTPSMSNNPHIIHRKRYRKRALPYLKVCKGSQGIEGPLSRVDGLNSALYGSLEHPRTVKHTNGRGEDRKKNR